MSQSQSQISPSGTATPLAYRQPTRNSHTVLGAVAFVLTFSACPSRRTQNAAGAVDASPIVDVVSVNTTANTAVDATPTPSSVGENLDAAGIMNSSTDGGPSTSTDGISAGANAPMSSFLSMDEGVIMRRLCGGAIARMQRNTGGSTLSFRVWFADGGKGLFKPQQSNSIANFRGEIAAYRMSRYLGMHRAPPACGRLMPRADLQRVADATGDVTFSQRVMSEILARGETVPGAMIFWVPGGLENVPGVERYPELLDQSRPLAEPDQTLAASLSSLILFDFINDNIDRWSGGNILRQRASAAQPAPPLLYIDNGAAFSVGRDNMGARPTEQTARLARVSRVSRSLVTRLRAMNEADLSREMALDPLGSPLPAASLQAVLVRKDRVIAHIDQLLSQHSESATYAFE